MEDDAFEELVRHVLDAEEAADRDVTAKAQQGADELAAVRQRNRDRAVDAVARLDEAARSVAAELPVITKGQVIESLRWTYHQSLSASFAGWSYRASSARVFTWSDGVTRDLAHSDRSQIDAVNGAMFACVHGPRRTLRPPTRVGYSEVRRRKPVLPRPRTRVLEEEDRQLGWAVRLGVDPESPTVFFSTDGVASWQGPGRRDELLETLSLDRYEWIVRWAGIGIDEEKRSEIRLSDLVASWLNCAAGVVAAARRLRGEGRTLHLT